MLSDFQTSKWELGAGRHCRWDFWSAKLPGGSRIKRDFWHQASERGLFPGRHADLKAAIFKIWTWPSSKGAETIRRGSTHRRRPSGRPSEFG